MGDRVVIGVLSNGELRLSYDHWMAGRLTEELLPGWAYFQHRADTGFPIGDWLDSAWGQGGVLIDQDRHVMLVYGGEETWYDRGYRHALVDLLAITWPGYRIRWCHELVLDIADYLHLPRDPYLFDRTVWYDKPPDPARFTPPEWDPAETDVTVVSAGRPTDRVVHGVVDTRDWEDFLAGPVVWRDVMLNLPYQLEPWYTPSTGAHFDFTAKRMTVWSVWEAAGILEDMARKWPRWRVDYTGDDPTKHELLSGLQLRRPQDIASTRYAEVIATAAERITTADTPDVAAMAQALKRDVHLNPHVHDTSVPTADLIAIAMDELRRLWATVLPNQPLPLHLR